MDGLLILDKPSGITSHDGVQEVRKLYGTRKVGHAGTLDPAATGVLIALLGRGTRLARFVQMQRKTYRAQVAFGVSTTTQDSSGDVVSTRPCTFTVDELRSALASFTGEIEQIPPMVSALHVQGERLWRKALRGEVIERAARRVHIYRLDLQSYDSAALSASLVVECSGGTYIRTLAHDIGEQLGCGAHVAQLRRLASGSFDESAAVTLEYLQTLTAAERIKCLLPLTEAVRDLAAVRTDDALWVTHGRTLPWESVSVVRGDPNASLYVVLGASGDVLGVHERSSAGLRPMVVL